MRTWIFIDSAQAGEFRVGTLSDERVRVATVRARSHRILPEIVKRVGLSAIPSTEGVCVVAGPGSFTAVRTGVLIANLLSRLFRKPLVGITVEDASDLSRLRGQLSTADYPRSSYVAPVYSSEPNITLPKRT